jgi:hypothetical protein
LIARGNAQRFSELSERFPEGGAYGNLGNAYQSLGDLDKAIKYHTQSLVIAKMLGDRAGEEEEDEMRRTRRSSFKRMRQFGSFVRQERNTNRL